MIFTTYECKEICIPMKFVIRGFYQIINSKAYCYIKQTYGNWPIKTVCCGCTKCFKKYHRQRDLYKLLYHIIEIVLRAINILKFVNVWFQIFFYCSIDFETIVSL